MSLGLKILSVEPGNVILSPLNIAHAFSILQSGSSGKTKERIERLLTPLDIETIASVVSHVPPEVAIAARLFLSAKFEIKSAFDAKSRKTFGALLSEHVTYDEPNVAVRCINAWVARSTDNRIENLVSSGDISPLTRLMIVSTIVFKGHWKIPFESTFQAQFNQKWETTFMRVSKAWLVKPFVIYFLQIII